MKNILIVAIILSAYVLQSQNLILNPSFEITTSQVTGGDQIDRAENWNYGCGVNTFWRTSYYFQNPGIPDLFDLQAVIPQYYNCGDQVKIPNSKWSNLSERNNLERYAGISGGKIQDVNGVEFTDYNETLLGTIGGKLLPNCNYSISFFGAAIQGYSINCYNQSPQYMLPNPDFNKVEIILRKDGDCENGKLIFTSNDIQDINWKEYKGNFSLTNSEALEGYNRVELRLTVLSKNYEFSNIYSHHVFIDDVKIELSPLPINPDFTINAIHNQGDPYYQITATVSNIPTGSSFWWMVCEVDNNGNIIGNMMIDPPNWQYYTLFYTNTFPGYCCNSSIYSGFGKFIYGHKYRISRATWSDCSPRVTIHKFVYLGPNKSTENSDTTEISNIEIGNSSIDTSYVNAMKINSEIKVSTDQVVVCPNPGSGIIQFDLSHVKINHDFVINIYSINGLLMQKIVI